MTCVLLLQEFVIHRGEINYKQVTLDDLMTYNTNYNMDPVFTFNYLILTAYFSHRAEWSHFPVI